MCAGNNDGAMLGVRILRCRLGHFSSVAWWAEMEQAQTTEGTSDPPVSIGLHVCKCRGCHCVALRGNSPGLVVSATAGAHLNSWWGTIIACGGSCRGVRPCWALLGCACIHMLLGLQAVSRHVTDRTARQSNFPPGHDVWPGNDDEFCYQQTAPQAVSGAWLGRRS